MHEHDFLTSKKKIEHFTAYFFSSTNFRYTNLKISVSSFNQCGKIFKIMQESAMLFIQKNYAIFKKGQK